MNQMKMLSKKSLKEEDLKRLRHSPNLKKVIVALDLHIKSNSLKRRNQNKQLRSLIHLSKMRVKIKRKSNWIWVISKKMPQNRNLKIKKKKKLRYNKSLSNLKRLILKLKIKRKLIRSRQNLLQNQTLLQMFVPSISLRKMTKIIRRRFKPWKKIKNLKKIKLKNRLGQHRDLKKPIQSQESQSKQENNSKKSLVTAIDFHQISFENCFLRLNLK